jgi:hypothetical protein
MDTMASSQLLIPTTATATIVYTILWICAFQGLILLLHKTKMPHACFNLSHHVIISGLSAYHLFYRWREVVFKEQAVLPMHMPHYIFLSYMIVDAVNHTRGIRVFKTNDWIHHTLCITYSIYFMIFDPFSIDAALGCLQEISTIFLTLIFMEIKTRIVNVSFLITFFITRIMLGGFITVQRTIGYYNDSTTLFNVSIWWVQFGVNMFFTKIILNIINKKHIK